jgi:hypothetical protein
MCDYSLHAVASRPAKVGERLVSTTFPHTTTRGFASADDPNTAVCLLPGTELAFDKNVEYRGIFFRRRRTNCNLARLRVANMDQSHLHHDTLELADGRTLLVTDLLPGQHVTVLQLPIVPADKPQHEQPARTEAIRTRPRTFASFF